jgi:uncharacterized protein YdeI (YjbR/CyaY-like superfamily)
MGHVYLPETGEQGFLHCICWAQQLLLEKALKWLSSIGTKNSENVKLMYFFP